MSRRSSISVPREGEAITKRYGKIGIAAVEAAVRYQSKKNSPTEPDTGSKSAGDRKTKITRGTSPRRH